MFMWRVPTLAVDVVTSISGRGVPGREVEEDVGWDISCVGSTDRGGGVVVASVVGKGLGVKPEDACEGPDTSPA